MLNIEKIGWRKLDENSSTTRESKQHLIDWMGTTTLCGVKVPSWREGYDLCADYGDGTCKRCAAKG